MKLVHDARVIRVERNPNNPQHIDQVRYLKDGQVKTLKANRFIIAAFTVQTARILLSSADDDRPAPGNRFDQLGRYLTSHPAGTIFGLFEKETQPHLGVTGGQLLSHDDYDDKSAPGGFGSSQWLIANAIKPHDLLGYGTSRPDIVGPKVKPWLEKAARHIGNMTLVAEDIAQPDNRITLSKNTDQDGIPLAHTYHDLSADLISRWDQRMAEGQAIFRAAGATDDVWQGPRVPMHIMGGAVMGRDERHSVTDSFGRVHDTDNLYVAGPSLFPSTGAVNPTFTLTALADRQADHLIN